MSSKTYYNWFNKNSNLDNLPVMGNIEPWPLEPVAWAAIMQLILSDLLAILMIIVNGMFYKQRKNLIDKRGKDEV